MTNTVDHIVREPERKRLTGLSLSTANRLEKNGAFPRSFRIGNIRAWKFSDIMNWINSHTSAA